MRLAKNVSKQIKQGEESSDRTIIYIDRMFSFEITVRGIYEIGL